ESDELVPLLFDEVRELLSPVVSEKPSENDSPEEVVRLWLYEWCSALPQASNVVRTCATTFGWISLATGVSRSSGMTAPASSFASSRSLIRKTTLRFVALRTAA